MAAKTIKNFLVGLGLDIDEKSFGEAETGLDMVGKKAIQMGAAVAGAFGAKALTFDFAAAVDQLGKFSQFLNVSADDVSALGGAIEQNGGTLRGFMSQLENIAQIRAGMLIGDFSFVEELGKLRIPREQVDAFRYAKDPIEAYLSLANMLRSANTDQRLGIANALGLDQASVLLLSRGRDEVEKLVEAQRRMQPITQKMTEQAADFNDNIQELSRNLSGLANIFSSEFLDPMNETMDKVNSLIDKNRGTIRGVAEEGAQLGTGATGAYTGAIGSQFDRLWVIWSSLFDVVTGDFEGLMKKDPEKLAEFLPGPMLLGKLFDSLSENPAPAKNLNPSPIPSGSASQLNLSPTFTILIDGNPIRAIVRDENGHMVRQTLKDTKRSAD